jgi:flagellar M-ring protein FliF
MLIKRSFEKEKEKAIQTMLDRTLGQDNSVVRVHADLIFDSREQRDERYFHDEDGPFIRSESTTEESSTQTNVEPAGIPGIDTNIPEYLEVPNTQGESTYEKETRDINYEINRTETVTRFSLGDVDYNYLTVSVLVNRSSPQQESLGDTEEERIQKIRNIVASATGLRENGNNGISLEDQISVAFIDFYTEPMPEPESTMVSHLLQSPYFPVLIALMALMLLIIMVLLLRKRSTGDMQETGSGFETIAEEELRLEDLIDKTLTPEEKERQRIRQEVERFIEENPEDAVQVVRIWLSEDSR